MKICKLHSKDTLYRPLGNFDWKCDECGGIYRADKGDREDMNKDWCYKIIDFEIEDKDAPFIRISPV